LSKPDARNVDFAVPGPAAPTRSGPLKTGRANRWD